MFTSGLFSFSPQDWYPLQERMAPGPYTLAHVTNEKGSDLHLFNYTLISSENI